MKPAHSLTQAIQLLERTLSLLVVFLLLAATVVPTGRLLGHDFGPAADDPDATARPDSASLAALGLAESRLTPAGKGLWSVSTETGTPAGTLVGSESLSPDATGYAGPTPVWVLVDASGHVAGVTAAPNAETPGVFRHVTESGFLDAWNGLTPAEALHREADAVSGATYSSRSLAANVQAALAAYTRSDPATLPQAASGTTPAAAATLAVVGLGVGMALAARRNRTARFVVLVLNVAVTGFWCGEYLSVSFLRSWIAEGGSGLHHLPAVVMLGVSILLAYARRPGHYCNWICPLGSLQELAYQLPGPKLRLAPRAFLLMKRIRLGVLCALLLMLWMGFGAWLLDYEPFGAFQFSSASWAVIALAGLFVVLGIFVPRPWCHLLCPLGELLQMGTDGHRSR